MLSDLYHVLWIQSVSLVVITLPHLPYDLFSHSDEKFPLWDQVPTEAIWHSKLTFFLNVKFRFYKPFKYKCNKYLSLFDIF